MRPQFEWMVFNALDSSIWGLRCPPKPSLLLKNLNCPLDSLLFTIQGSCGGDVPDVGYVEIKFQITCINKFIKDVLMLVLPDSPYEVSVPVQVGYIH